MRVKISIVLLGITLLVSSGLALNQAYAGGGTCQSECQGQANLQEFVCKLQGEKTDAECEQDAQDFLNNCLRSCPVGGEFIGIETTSVLAAGAQYTAAWMIPAIVSAIGIGIVIARKF